MGMWLDHLPAKLVPFVLWRLKARLQQLQSFPRDVFYSNNNALEIRDLHMPSGSPTNKAAAVMTPDGSAELNHSNPARNRPTNTTSPLASRWSNPPSPG